MSTIKEIEKLLKNNENEKASILAYKILKSQPLLHKDLFEFLKKLKDNNEKLKIILVDMLFDGIGCTKSEENAIILLKKLKEKNNHNAMYKLANYYKNSNFAKNKSLEIESLFREAANLNNVDAMYQLADIYKNGFYEIEKDSSEYIIWIIKSAENGHKKAQVISSKILIEGFSDDMSMQKPNIIKGLDFIIKASNSDSKLKIDLILIMLKLIQKEIVNLEDIPEEITNKIKTILSI